MKLTTPVVPTQFFIYPYKIRVSLDGVFLFGIFGLTLQRKSRITG